MKGYLGVMNVRSIKEALTAANGLWTHYPLISKPYSPLVGFDVDFIRKKEGESSLEERLLMFSAASIDSADFALCYSSPILNANEFFRGLKEVLSIPNFTRKTKAVYFSQDWPGISIANELKFKFPNLQIISAIEKKDETPENMDYILKILSIYRKNIDCLAIAPPNTNGQKREYQSLKGRSRYLELHDKDDQSSDSPDLARDFIERMHMQELRKMAEKIVSSAKVSGKSQSCIAHKSIEDQAHDENRTRDLGITNAVLHLLSYMGA
jgi:hypothetical protein